MISSRPKHHYVVIGLYYLSYHMIKKGYIIFPVTRSNFEIITVQAPHPPSAQPSFVPVNPTKSYIKDE